MRNCPGNWHCDTVTVGLSRARVLSSADRPAGPGPGLGTRGLRHGARAGAGYRDW